VQVIVCTALRNRRVAFTSSLLTGSVPLKACALKHACNTRILLISASTVPAVTSRHIAVITLVLEHRRYSREHLALQYSSMTCSTAAKAYIVKHELEANITTCYVLMYTYTHAADAMKQAVAMMHRFAQVTTN
jgi:hypothetical protein